MPRGKKTDNKMVAKIMASYALTNSYNATAKELKISGNTVKKVILDNKSEFAKVCEVKKTEFAEQAGAIIDKALILVDKRIDSALKEDANLDKLIEEIQLIDNEEMSQKEKASIVSKIRKLQLNSLSELTTVIGTLYDKQRLAKGESTGNDKFEFVLKVE